MLGVVIVAASVLVGSLLFARADDSTHVWTARRALVVGATVTSADVGSVRVGLADDDLGRYLPTAGGSPVGKVVRREVAVGELLPAGALGDGAAEVGVRVPLAVAVADLPGAVQVGTVVDVWVTAREGIAGDKPSADRVFTDVPVVAISRDRGALAPESVRSVVVLVPGAAEVPSFGDLIGAAAAGRVILTQRQGGPPR